MQKDRDVYLTEEYKNALKIAGAIVVEISSDFFAVEKKIKLPGIGTKKILEARGSPEEKDLEEFKKKAKDYFYGTIAASILNKKERIFEKLGYKKAVNYTILIDLKKGEDELWKNLEKKSIRWGVKTAEKNGLKFEKSEKEGDFNSFYSLYSKTATDGKFQAEKKDFILFLIKTNTARLFLVKKDEKVMAGGLILLDKANNYSILDLTASSSTGLEMQAMPFLYWNLALYSKKSGFSYFDLGGYDTEAKENEKTYKINKFKERFGGKVEEQPIFATNSKYTFLRSMLKKLRFLRKMYRKE